jgi:hypothetical protein
LPSEGTYLEIPVFIAKSLYFLSDCLGHFVEGYATFSELHLFVDLIISFRSLLVPVIFAILNFHFVNFQYWTVMKCRTYYMIYFSFGIIKVSKLNP